MNDAVEQNVVNNGQVSQSMLDSLFTTFKTDVMTEIATSKNARATVGTGDNSFVQVEDDEEEVRVEAQRVDTTTPVSYSGFTHSGKISYWDVPQTFKFPEEAGRENGFRLWIVGMPDFEIKVGGTTKRKAIKPLREFKSKRLPTQLRSQYNKA